MPDVTLTWTWITESPLHCGSGLSRPGYADRLVHIGQDRMPRIPGEAVKGAVRMAAEQVVAWLDRPARYRDTEPKEPQLSPLRYIFAREDGARFSPGTLSPSDDDRGDPAHTRFAVAATRIDRGSGVAFEQTLRTNELVAPGRRFACAFRASIPTESLDGALTLLVAAVLATENVGGKASIGWGRVTAADLALACDGVEIDPRTCVTPERLSSLRETLVAGRERVEPVEGHNRTGEPGVAHGDTGEPGARPTHVVVARTEPAAVVEPYEWFQLDVQLLEPACFPTEPEVSNKVSTEQGIRATVLRGACRAAWLARGVPESEVLAFLGAHTRWSPGFPVWQGTLAVPSPLSFQVAKRAGSTRFGAHDSVAVRPGAEREETGRRVAPKSLAKVAPWAIWDGEALERLRVERQTKMHVHRDYVTRSKVTGALYARESIVDPDVRFRAWAYLPRSAWRTGTELRVQMGKRTSAGNGAAIVRVMPVSTPVIAPSAAAPPLWPDAIFVQLLSPAIVRDEHGYPRASLTTQQLAREVERAWAAEAAGDIGSRHDTPIAAEGPRTAASPAPLDDLRVAASRRGGWMSTWRNPRAPVTVLQAGSVWRLDLAQHPGLRGLHHLAGLLLQIGERRHEGFGWLSVQPSWLGVMSAPPGEPQVERPSSDVPADRWPGCETLSSEDLARIIDALPGKIPEEASGPLQDLAQRARDATTDDDCRPIAGLWAVRTRKERPNQWEHVAEGTPAHRLLDRYWGGENPSLPHLRFALEALLTRARAARRS